ncbi:MULTISPECIES: caspase family protein [unclassified Moorena]|uniref:caspase family protein n=1 Tax=unclassified Moorena TaxID=2683338 RepID=UPI0013FF6D69|nr:MULTISPECIES: caspase family protein [unclassified Moorena]NEO13600.1 caspase [Moorena sp. SIO3E8]NEP99934.1 caspase [Moorena sp. SIO3F7]
MTQTIYALLVGIDNYRYPLSPLKGCVNDITAISEYLQEGVTEEGYRLHTQILKDQQATRQAIINGFQEFLSQAGSKDVALFYYSGHGSQEESPPEFWHLEPDHLNETLVCWDSRTEGGWDLADKELAKLIALVAKKNPHIVVILDCCHSGAGTRKNLLNTTVRRVPTDRRQRPFESFIFSVEEINHLSRFYNHNQNQSNWFVLPQGEHILLAACRENEDAKECYGNNRHQGVFSYFLIDTLRRANGNLTYRDLFKRTNALVRSRVTAQSPQLEATNSINLDQPFLGGAIAERQPYLTVIYNETHGWVIDGGAVHGIPPVSGEETTRVAIFPFNSALEQLRQVSQALGLAEVTEVLPQLSKIKISQDSEKLDPELTYKAVVISLPLPPLGVYLQGDEKGVTLARQAIQEASFGEQASLYIREVVDSEDAEFCLIARDRQYLITRPVDDRPLIAPILGYTALSASRAIQRLEHIARWTNIVTLSNTARSQIRSDSVTIQVYQGDSEITEPQIRLQYQYENGEWKKPAFRVKLTNSSNESLYIALLYLTDRYAVSARLFPAGGVWLEPGQEAWAFDGKPIYANVPTTLWKQGITEYKDILKLIVSTTEFDATLLEQDKLELAVTRSTRDTNSTTGYQVRGTLNRLMNRIQIRDFSDRPEEEELSDDWNTNQLVITTVRPLPKIRVPNIGREGVSLGSGVELQSHPCLRANVRLTTVTQSSQDLGNLILPALLRDNPEVTQPFQFTASRGTDPGLSVLELSSIDAHSIAGVTPEAPLTLLVDTALAEGEYILPIGYDGEFFLPLGLGKTKPKGKTEISIEGLTDPISEGKRSVHGSIRIFFQKVVSPKLGLKFPYPILAAAEVAEDGSVSYEADVEKVKAKVAQAKRIVLYIHGIMGDTHSLVPSIHKATVEVDGQPYSLSEYYDLVLTFDYENINTTIEKNAQLLKQRLEVVGLKPSHGKVLHIIAHSMGGLVSRWFIEREKGNQIVQHLVMLGTPNGGSPWSSVHAWVTTTLAIGLNGFSTVAWPTAVLGSLLATTEIIDVSLDQMQPGSKFLKSLAASPDPGVPYTIIAGNTSIIPAAVVSGQLERLMQKLRKVVELPFFGQPNDIAVTVQSIKSVSGGRLPQPQTHEVACDHLTYFSDQAGLSALGVALTQALESTSPSISDPIVKDPHKEGDNPISFSSKPGVLMGVVIGLLSVAVIIIFGLMLAKRSPQKEPPKEEISRLLPGKFESFSFSK